jgi:1-acyl-sn-glycerol-3-phosphate acyltransferase
LTNPPFLADFIAKLGGILACQENGDYVLQRDELLGVFPEGIRGAFTMYTRAYTLGKFGRDEFVRMALRNGASIIPFVTVGSAEIYPILRRIDWSWFKRYTEWPFLPITPAPFPLPSKWHTRFLPPMHIEQEYPPEAARDPAIVHRISLEVRQRMQVAIDEMLERRRSIFFGSLFDGALQP